MNREVCEHYNLIGECYECEQERLNDMRRQPTLRDRFAMAALTGISGSIDLNANDCDAIAAVCYDYADAMMKCRETKPDWDADKIMAREG
jgi:hypothetical protein